MLFKKHIAIEGTHAFLSASKYHWLNYDDEKLESTYLRHLAAKKGTELHEFACEAIRLGIKLPRSKKTLNMYVNDAIGYRMTPEQVLYYSQNAFGTADAISYRDSLLRIHDLKTGVTTTSMRQLDIYAALFCLEYKVNPLETEFENRIYQNDDVVIEYPKGSHIRAICKRIVDSDKIIERINVTLEV